MVSRSAPAPGLRDALLIAGALAVAAIALATALGQAPDAPTSTRAEVAVISVLTGSSKVRPAETLLWRDVSPGMGVHDGDAVFVGPGSAAALRFSDGSELDLDERSLVVVEPPKGARRTVYLRKGSVSGRAGSEGLLLSTSVGEAGLEPKSEARLELHDAGFAVTVAQGRADLRASGGIPLFLESGQRAVASAEQVAPLAPWPVRLVAPEPNLYETFLGHPKPVELVWRGLLPQGSRVQLARDRFFAFVEVERPAETGQYNVAHPRPGVSWWRVVDAKEQPLSEARRFTVAEEVVPMVMAPQTGEVVLAVAGQEIAFAWTPIAGVSRFRLEVSPSQAFEPLALSEDVQGSAARMGLPLPEGNWYWRVRAANSGAALGAPSAPARFRLIHREIPQAPELLAPEVEVSP